MEAGRTDVAHTPRLLVGDFRIRLTTKRPPPPPPKPDMRRIATDPRVQQEYAAAVTAAYVAGEMESYDAIAETMTTAALATACRDAHAPGSRAGASTSPPSEGTRRMAAQRVADSRSSYAGR